VKSIKSKHLWGLGGLVIGTVFGAKIRRLIGR